MKRKTRKIVAKSKDYIVVICMMLAGKCCYGTPSVRAKMLHSWVDAWLAFTIGRTD